LAIKIIVAVVVLLLSVLVIWRFQSLIAPLVLASILAYLLNPLISLAVQRLNVGRGVAVLIVYGLLLLIAIGGGVALGYVAFDQASRLIELLPDNFEDAAGIFQAQFSDLAQRTIAIGPYTVGLTNLPAGLSIQNLVQQLVDVLRPIFSGGGTLAAQVAQATISGISIGFLVLVLSIYIAKDTPKIWSSLSDLATQPGYRQDADRLLAEFSRIWDAYLRGQVILALVIGVIVSLMLSLLGVTSALGLGALSGILEFLPIVGPFVGTSAAVLVAFFQSETIWGLQSWQYALLIAALMGLIQALENNILVPRIVGDALDLHPLLVMISVLMGASLAGILGAILAAPVVATIKLLGSYAWRKMLDLPPFPEPLGGRPSSPAPPSLWQRVMQTRTWLTALRTQPPSIQPPSTHPEPGMSATPANPQHRGPATKLRKSNKKRTK
jgi:predicted PurR-regulated permease PerM